MLAEGVVHLCEDRAQIAVGVEGQPKTHGFEGIAPEPGIGDEVDFLGENLGLGKDAANPRLQSRAIARSVIPNTKAEGGGAQDRLQLRQLAESKTELEAAIPKGTALGLQSSVHHPYRQQRRLHAALGHNTASGRLWVAAFSSQGMRTPSARATSTALRMPSS